MDDVDGLGVDHAQECDWPTVLDRITRRRVELELRRPRATQLLRRERVKRRPQRQEPRISLRPASILESYNPASGVYEFVP